MPTVMFWNVGSSSKAAALIGRLAAMHQIDVIVLAECDDTSASLVSQIDAVCGTGTYVEAAHPIIVKLKG